MTYVMPYFYHHYLPACDNIMSKINMIDNNCKKDAGAETATTIIAKFNKKEDFKTDCRYVYPTTRNNK